MSIRLYVGNLPKDVVDRQEFQDVFAEAGDDIISAKVIKQRKTGKCRGFGFVTVKTEEQADQLIEKFNGHMFKDSPLKIEKAQPRAKSDKEDEEGEVKQEEPSVPRQKPTTVKSGGGGGGVGRSTNNRNRRSGSSGGTTSPAQSDGSVQPDPRWADKLEQLKEMLAAQTTNS
ncbi:MAG: RNA-binding protein [Coleofasciculaceae cyanobacterium SM2_3_26]|nr:RNA-binding protein [Coleofasciculaceae cyanobacterium SM2_3_26]